MRGGSWHIRKGDIRNARGRTNRRDIDRDSQKKYQCSCRRQSRFYWQIDIFGLRRLTDCKGGLGRRRASGRCGSEWQNWL